MTLHSRFSSLWEKVLFSTRTYIQTAPNYRKRLSNVLRTLLPTNSILGQYTLDSTFDFSLLNDIGKYMRNEHLCRSQQ